MLYAIKLGPIETDDGNVHAYVGIHEGGYLASPVLMQRDTDALRELAADAPPGADLVCEKRLARAGRPLGFTAAEMPDWAAEPRAALAAMLALGPHVLPMDPDALHFLFESSAAFWRAKPWRYWTDNDIIEVVLTGAVEARFEAALMGAAGMEYGVALYSRPGAIARIAQLVDSGRMSEGRHEDTLAVTFDDEPRFAISALRQAYRLAHLPVPMQLEGGRMMPPGGREIAILASTLHLLAKMTPRTAGGSLIIGSDDEQIEVEISMPPLVS